MTSWIRCLFLLALVPALAEASPPATAAPAGAPEIGAAVPAEAGDAPATGPKQRKVRLEARMYMLRGGGMGELAWCDRREPATWSMYSCWAFNVGHQDGRWAGGELATAGARYRPGRGPVTIFAGAGAGLLTMFVDIFLNCPARGGRIGGSGECRHKLIPFELATELGVRTAFSTGRVGVAFQIIARYHANTNGVEAKMIGRVPVGPMISAGASLMF